MSQYYNVDGKSVWNPGMSTSGQFLAYIRVFEAELGMPSGIGPMYGDEAEIDVPVYAAFVSAFLNWYRVRTGSDDTELMAAGFLTIVLALAQRAGAVIDWPEEEQPWPRLKLATLRERAHVKANQMAA